MREAHRTLTSQRVGVLSLVALVRSTPFTALLTCRMARSSSMPPELGLQQGAQALCKLCVWGGGGERGRDEEGA